MTAFTTATAITDVAMLTDFVRRKLPSEWQRYPGGWPGQIEAALIDAVLSIRAKYGKPQTGVRGAVARWREHRGGRTVDDLTYLADCQAADLATILQNRQKLSGKAFKAQAIVDAANALLSVGVRHARDLNAGSPVQRRAYSGVPGLGSVTWNYLGMLVGTEGVKADTWILRFVREALGVDRSAAQAEHLLIAVAKELEVDAATLDHAIWSHMRSRK